MPNGKPSSTQDNIKYLLKPLRKLYGDVAVDDFGPLALNITKKKDMHSVLYLFFGLVNSSG
ncbi:MAG: hypothetical protein NTY42_17635 [Planctomycetota bacterium]|nr:hypothetical protein [Planctomycetota bacterium]